MLELALKYRLYAERVKDDPNSSWEHIEQIDLTKVINDLRKRNIITQEQKSELDKFNTEARNDYIHYKIRNMIKNLKAKELTSVNIKTGEVTIHKDIKALDRSELWFSAKKALDKKTLTNKVNFCISWVNYVLAKPSDEKVV